MALHPPHAAPGMPPASHASGTPRLDAVIRAAAARLSRAGTDSPQLCARLLACEALGLSRTGSTTEAARLVTPVESARITTLMDRRTAGEPLAYILGRKEFFGRDFAVTPQTLIPRPETELLVEAALKELPAHAPLHFVDLGTGSGCIGISAALERPHWSGLLLDISLPALRTAAANARDLGAASRLSILQGDLCAAPLQAAAFDLVLSNPPYIAAKETKDIAADVLRCEPHHALFSAQDGLAHLRGAIHTAARALKPGGLVLLEHGFKQGPMVRAALAEAGFSDIRTLSDAAGLERCGAARRL